MPIEYDIIMCKAQDHRNPLKKGFDEAFPKNRKTQEGLVKPHPIICVKSPHTIFELARQQKKQARKDRKNLKMWNRKDLGI